eukprot:1120156-Alexandrium_andersonii.AAC.1
MKVGEADFDGDSLRAAAEVQRAVDCLATPQRQQQQQQQQHPKQQQLASAGVPCGGISSGGG